MKVGFVCGVFDLFHAGHVRMLSECKLHCDYLILALNRAKKLSPDKNIPIFTIDERVEIMQSCKLVDEVHTYEDEDDLIELLKRLSPDIRFLGEDYINKNITGKNFSKEIYFTNRQHGLSTSNYLKKIISQYK